MSQRVGLRYVLEHKSISHKSTDVTTGPAEHELPGYIQLSSKTDRGRR